LLGWLLAPLRLARAVHRSWNSLFGPVFFYDLVRSARRSNFALLRSTYAAALLAMLYLVYSTTVHTQATSFWDVLWSPGHVAINSIARFGEGFFLVFVGVQFAAVILLTPLCAAGAITEEKERRTIDYVLATDLGDGEVVVGKLTSRLSYLVLFLLTGLPVLSVLELLGGVDPNLVLSSFVMTAMTMLSLASLSVACSVLCNKTRGAVFLTYLFFGCYLLLSSCCGALPLPWLTAGNLAVAAHRLFGAASGTTPFANLLGIVIDYSLFHVIGALICCLWAAANLRARSERPASYAPEAPPLLLSAAVERTRRSALPSGDGDNGDSADGGWGPWDRNPDPVIERALATYPHLEAPKRRPPVGERPVLWKELYAERIFRLGTAGQTIAFTFTFITLLLLGYMLILSLAAATSQGSLSTFTNGLARFVGNGLACALLLAIAIRAAGSLSSERERQTLDGLLTTTLDNRTLLFDKWLGSILSLRKPLILLLLLWMLAVLTGGIELSALLALMCAVAAYAAFVSAVGLIISLVSRSSLVAVVATVVTVIAVSSAHRAVWLLYEYSYYPRMVPPERQWIGNFELYGLTPPLTMGVLAFRWQDFEAVKTTRSEETIYLTRQLVAYALIGTGLFALAALALWGLLLKCFVAYTGRMPLSRRGSVLN
jgi:ABC-type transport system involved in multi-copper enzyme maturation permease subunit